MKVKIRGVKYDLRFVEHQAVQNDLVDALGWCESPRDPNPKIRIDASLDDKELMRVVLHEIMHAGLWDLNETAIDEVSTAGQKVLWKLGYRRVE